MADYDLSWLDSYDNAIKSTPDQEEKEKAGWLDVPKEYGAQLAGLAAAPLGAAQVATATSHPAASEIFGGLGMAAHGVEEGLREGESPVSRRAAEATMIPEEGKPWMGDTPIRSLAMQGAGIAAFGTALAAVAAVAPEGFLAGLATDAAAGGVLGATQVADKAAQYYNNPDLTDKKLAEEDPRFKMLTEQGVDPKEARNIRMQEMVHASPLLANGFAGAVGMGVGGRVLRRTTGGTGGALSRFVLGAGENAAGMGGMAAAGTYADQDLEIAQGKRQDYDGRKILMSFAQGAALGAAVGGVGGVLHKPDGRRVREDNTPTVEHTDNSQLDSTRAVALAPPTPAAPIIEPSTLAAPTSRPLEPSRDKSQGVSEELAAGLKGELPPPETPLTGTGPEIPVVHPGEPETPIATVAHPGVPEITPPEPSAVEPVAPAPEPPAPVTQQVTEPVKGTLLPEGYKGPKAATDASGASAAVGLHYTEHPDVFTVDGSFLPDNLRGKGVGYKLYKQLADKAIAAGKPLISDYNVSEDALRIYKKLEKDGYNVEYAKGLHEGTEEAYPGSYIPGEDDSFTVRVTGKKPEAVGKTKAPAPEPPVTEARVDPATGRRILEGPRWGEKDEGWQKMPGQTEDALAAAPKVIKEEPSKGHSAQKVLDQQAKNHEIATRILNNEPPLQPFTENTAANRDILRNRLQNQVSEALASGFGVIKKAAGSPFENRIPERVHKQPGEVMWLADAQRMLRRFNSKKPVKLEEMNKFITDENAGRSGQWDVMATRRKGEGAEFGEAKKKEAAAEAAPEEVSGGDAMDKLESKEPSPEDIILQHEEELKRQLEARAHDEPVEEEPTQEAPSRERPAPKIEGEAYTVPKERTAPVVVERGRSRRKMPDKVAEKVALSRKLKDKVEQEAKKPPLAVFGDTKAERDARDALISTMRESVRDEHIVPNTYTDAKNERASQVVSVKKIFSVMGRTGVEERMKGIESAFFPIFRNRVLEHIGDMKVYIVDREQIKRLSGFKEGAPLGYYDPTSKHIVLRDDAVANPHDAAWVLLHEGLHAAYHDAIEYDPRLKENINHVIAWVESHIRANEPELINKQRYTYGLTNEHEFISEAFSNNDFQELLSRVEIPSNLARDLGLGKKEITAWDWLLGQLRKVFKLPKNSYTALEAAVRLGEHADTTRHTVNLNSLDNILAAPSRTPLRFAPERDTTEETFRNVLARGAENAHEQLSKFAADPVNRTTELARDIANQPDLSKAARAFSNLFLANHMHLQRIKHLNKELVGAIYNTIERAGTYARKLRDAIAPHIADGIRLEKKVPGLYAEAVDIMHGATRYGADPTSALGVGRNARLAVNKKVQGKLDKGAKIEDLINDVNANHISAILAHPELARRYQELIKKEPKFERFIKDTFSYYDEVQLAQSKNIIHNALEATGKFPERADLNKRVNELSDMVFTKENKEALQQEIGDAALDHVIKGKALVGNGPYAPLIRRGDWVVRGKYKVKEPTNAIQKVGPNIFEFATKKEAVDFGESSGLHATYDTVHYDPTTGEKTTKLGGVSVAGGPEQRWVATLQHEHMEQHESLKVAQRQYEDLKKSGLFEELHAPVAHRDYTNNLSGELTHGAVRSLLDQLRKTDVYQRADGSAQAEMRHAIVVASRIGRMGNRVSSRSIPRRNVPGFSKDFTRNLVEYTTASSYERAKQVYRPQIDDLLGQLDHSVRNLADKHETDRSVELNEVIKRARAPNPEEYTGKFAEIARRIGIWSYIDRMMRISHLILHQTHLPMITAPIIAGRHGVARTYATIASTWRDAFPAMKAGGIDFKNALYDPLIQGTDYSTFIGGLFKGAKDHAHLMDMIQKLNEDGTIHPQAGIEVHKYTPSQQLGGPLGGLDKTMSYLDTTFRHLTNATEAINRHVGAIAAYRLEFQKLRRQGLTDSVAHERAVAYTSDILKNTQGLYSSTNAAPLFKVPYLRPFLQFKQFPQMMYHLMARSLLNGFKKMPEGLDAAGQKEFRMQRADALRGLTYLLSTHALATGLLGGLPTEPLKYVGAVTKALGVTSDDFTAVDRWLYDKAVANFGKEGAEWLMHGLARGLGPDVHHRMGMSSLTSWGLDKVTSAADFKGFLFDQALGAPGSLAADTFTGIRQMADANNMNEVTTGALKAFPLQAMRDVQKAWTGKGSGKYEYSPFERGVRALGFTPVGEAEEAERKAETYRQVDQYNQERRTLMRKWADADAPDKGSAWSRIQKFNKDKPKDSQITMKQLTDAAKRRKKGEDEGDIVHGVRLNKQTRFIGERANAIYN